MTEVPRRAVARRWLFTAPPPGAASMSGWALLPLRIFLGATFCFAGLQKLSNPNFLNAKNPSGIQAQMIAAARFSPLHSILGHLLQVAAPIGVLIALGELAVGLGALLGLWTRIAAIGGILLSLTLFLTVSFHSSPYYTGADIVFVFAWMPVVLAGSGGVLSLDAVIASWTRHEVASGSPTPVPVRFSMVQQVCGNYADDRCSARHGAKCDTRGCPFLVEARRRTSRTAVFDGVDRRTFVLGGSAAALTAGVGLLTAGLVAGIGRLVGGAKPPTGGTAVLPSKSQAPPASSPTSPVSSPAASPPASNSTPTSAVPAGTPIGPVADVAIGGAARFTDPSTGDPALVLQLSKGSFVAYDAICPHTGCTVGYSTAASLIVCPCHGSEFSPDTGAVEVGPAPRGLTVIPVQAGSDGQLYVNG